MTTQELKKKWVVIVFFSTVVLIFTYFIYFLATGTYDANSNRWISKTDALNSLPQGEGNFLLAKDQAVTAGKLQITYRGIASGTLLVDLVILDLDPSYAYRHRIPLQKAVREFNLSDARFRVSSATPKNIRLERRP